MFISKKKYLYGFFLLFLLFSKPLFSEEHILPCSFFELEGLLEKPIDYIETIQGKRVEIRGFLYETKQSQAILAAEPNLKSCCVGSEAKKHKQIVVKGDVSSAIDRTTAVNIQGNLKIDLKDPFPFKLENAVIAEGNKQSYGMLAIVLGGLLLVGLAGIFWRRQ